MNRDEPEFDWRDCMLRACHGYGDLALEAREMVEYIALWFSEVGWCAALAPDKAISQWTKKDSDEARVWSLYLSNRPQLNPDEYHNEAP